VSLTIAEADGAVKRLSYFDGEGDEVTLDLTDVAINPISRRTCSSSRFRTAPGSSPDGEKRVDPDDCDGGPNRVIFPPGDR
jgi:hypothetical protein